MAVHAGVHGGFGNWSVHVAILPCGNQDFTARSELSLAAPRRLAWRAILHAVGRDRPRLSGDGVAMPPSARLCVWRRPGCTTTDREGRTNPRRAEK